MWYHENKVRNQDLTRDRARSHIPLLNFGARRNIKVENVDWYTKRCARIRNLDTLACALWSQDLSTTYINNPSDMALHGCARQQQVDLIVRVSIPPQVFNHPQTSLSVRHSGIEVVLLAVFIDAETFEVDVSSGTKLGLDWTWHIDWALGSKLCHSVLHHAELDRDNSCHFNGSTEGDLAISLRKVQITNGELGSLDVHWKVDFATAGQVLDIAVAAVLGSTRNGSCSLFANLLFDVRASCTSVNVDGLWWLRDIAVHVAACLNQSSLPLVPGAQHFVAWSTSEDTWVDQAGETNTGDVAGAAEDAVKVPDRFGGFGVDFIEEALQLSSLALPMYTCLHLNLHHHSSWQIHL